MMKRMVIVGLAVMSMLTANAWVGPHGWGCGPCPPPPCPGWGCGGGWGRGGCNFWPAFTGAAVGTLVGGAIANAVTPRQTVVVQQPVVQPVVQQPVVVQPTYVRPAYTSEVTIGTPGTTVIYR